MSTSSFSDLKFKLAFAAWWVIWSVLQIIVLLDFGLGYKQAVIDSLTSNALLVVACLVISTSMRFYVPGKEKYWYVILVSLALSGAWLVIVRVVLWSLFGNDPDYMVMLLRSSTLRYGVAFLMVGCMAMMSLIWYTQQDEMQVDDRKREAEKIAKDAELFKLRQQLQPHFLFNSLNSISALVGQPERARHMIQQLSDFLRGTLRNDELLWTNLADELKYLQLYLDIEKVRFGHRLQTDIIFSGEALEMKLPAMLLQPIVENAIKFGLYDTIGEVVISIKAENKNGLLEVGIQNPFDDESMHQHGTGFGLSSIRRRLYLIFARHDLLTTAQQNNQFSTTVIIPQIV